MANNKIEYFGQVLIDLTQDTVTADKLLKGYTAHDKSGNIIVGTHECSGEVNKHEQNGDVLIIKEFYTAEQNDGVLTFDVSDTLVIKQTYNAVSNDGVLEIDNPTLIVISAYGTKQNNNIMEVR